MFELSIFDKNWKFKLLNIFLCYNNHIRMATIVLTIYCGVAGCTGCTKVGQRHYCSNCNKMGVTHLSRNCPTKVRSVILPILTTVIVYCGVIGCTGCTKVGQQHYCSNCNKKGVTHLARNCSS